MVNWQGYIWDTDVFEITIILSILSAIVVLLWTALRGIWQSPAAIGSFFNRRREKRGLEALSSGMIAIGAGDRSLATRYAVQARKSLPNEPMTHLLRAQAAQLAGDRTTSRRIFEAMLSAPDTEALGLRGLFLEAEREGEKEAARQFAERAVKLNPKLSWPVDALFDIQCRSSDWEGALETLAIAKRHNHIEKPLADRRRAVLLAGQAQACEDKDPERALNLALEAHNLATDLVPAAAVAGRLLAARGNTPRATKILQKSWRKAPHPDLAVAYAYARLGDSPRDRLQRVRELARLAPNIIESPIAVANAAIEARAFEVAREALEPLLENRLTQRVCTLMARIEGENGNAGGVREWLARAVNAPRDPAWTADGIVSETWQPVSPVTGALDAFQWRVPLETAEPRSKELLAEKIEELVKLGVHPETMIGAAATMDDAGVETDAPPPSAGAGNGASKSKGKAVAEAVDVEAVEIVKPAREPDDSATDNRKSRKRKRKKSGGRSEATVARSADRDDVATDGPAGADAASEIKSDSAAAAAVPATVVVAANTDNTDDEPAGKPDAGKPDAGKPDDGEVTIDSETVDSDKAAARSVPTSAPSKQRPAPAEPQIFVSPRAPDDPGTDQSENSATASRSPMMPFQPAKG